MASPFTAVKPIETDFEMEYVAIPAENALGEMHPTVQLNRLSFVAGHTYKLPKDIATDLKDRLKVYAKSVVRIMQPRCDLKSQNEVSVGSANMIGSRQVEGNRFDVEFGQQ